MKVANSKFQLNVSLWCPKSRVPKHH